MSRRNKMNTGMYLRITDIKINIAYRTVFEVNILLIECSIRELSNIQSLHLRVNSGACNSVNMNQRVLPCPAETQMAIVSISQEVKEPCILSTPLKALISSHSLSFKYALIPIIVFRTEEKIRLF